MRQRILLALVIPVVIQMLSILIWQRRSWDLLVTAHEFASALVFFTMFWGLLVLIPLGVAQLISMILLARSSCDSKSLLFAGLLNPALALITILLVGWPF